MALSINYKTALRRTNIAIVNAVPSPTILLSHQHRGQIFTAIEEEKVRKEENEKGSQSGTRLLLEILKSKGQEEFNEFLCLLQDPDLQLQSLHDLLNEEYTKELDCHGSSASSKLAAADTKGCEDCIAHEPYQLPVLSDKSLLSPDNFLKDIPPRIAIALVRRLNVPDSLGKDWRGVADCLNLTHEQTLESSNKMRDMLDLMIQRNFKIDDLLVILKKLKRYDVVELFTSDEKWLKTEEKAVQTEAEFRNCSCNCVDSEEVSLPATVPVDTTVDCASEDSSSYSSVEDSSQNVVSKLAIIIANMNYNDLTKLDDFSDCVENLKEALKLHGWHVSCYTDCLWREMKTRCNRFMKITKQSIVLLYYVGHSVQIYSENYLLPVDICADDTKTDIILKSLKLSSLLRHLDDSVCNVVIIDSGYKTSLAQSRDCIVDGLGAFEPTWRNLVCLICPLNQARSGKSRDNYIRCFTDCLKNKPADLGTFLTETVERLADAVTKDARFSPVIISRSKDVFPITLNSATVFVRPRDAFLVKKSALIVVVTALPNDSFDDAEFQELYTALKTMLWEVELVINPEAENIYQVVKHFLKRSNCELNLIFLFGTFCQIREENFLVLNSSCHEEDSPSFQGCVSVRWIVDSMGALSSGYKVLILENIASDHDVSLAHMDSPPKMLISLPRNESDRCTDDVTT